MWHFTRIEATAMANPVASHRQSYHQNMPQSRQYPDNQRNHEDSLHAAEVLASFHQYPIRDATQFIDYTGLDQDPLVQDMKEHSRDLVVTLLPILRIQEGDPGTSYDINNCKGVNHIPGSMMPGEEDLSSPTTRSSLSGSSHGRSIPIQQQIYQSPIIKNEPSPTTSIKPETPGFQTTFQFVVNENAKEARNTVRKHVMKEFRRRERWEQVQKGTAGGDSIGKKSAPSKKRRRKDTPESDLQTPIENQVLSNYQPTELRKPSTSQEIFSPIQLRDMDRRRMLKEKRTRVFIPPTFPESRQHQLCGAVSLGFDQAIVELENDAHNSGPYQHDPWSTVAVSQVDPFTKLNLDLGPATQSLLHHFAWVMPSLMDSIVTGKTFHRIGWLYSAVAVHDPTPVHVILGYTLGHVASLRGLEEPPQALEHKSKAIKLLHHRMEDPEQCYSNGLIGAIVNFAAWEVWF